MNIKKMIGALTAKFAVALMAFGCITGAWGATITVGSSGADYTTLKAAFAAVSDGDTVQLIEDIAYSTTQAWNDKLVVNGKKVTFDLNGHNVTYTRSANPSGPMFYLQNGAELLIDGTGTIVLTPITTSHTVFPCVSMDGNTGLKATLGENVTVYAECFGSVEYNTKNAETGSTFDIYGTIIGNNSSFMNNLFSCSSGVTNFTVNVIGGTLEISKYSDMHVNIQASTETIFNFNMASGKIYCTQANFNAVKFNLFAAVKSTFNITGGYFGSNAPTDGNNPARGFSLADGYGFYPVSGVANCPYQVGVCEAKIGNVCYPSVSAAIEAATASNFVALNVDYSDVVTIPAGKTVNFNGGSYTFSGSFTVNGTLRIVGGTYTFNPAAALLGPGCSVTDNGDGTWTVIQSVAQVGETAYSTFADALAAANALGTATIKFLADVDLGSSSINIAAGKNITLDLNGNNLTCSASDQFLVKSGATLILCDTSDGASGTLTHSGQYDLSDNSGTVEILSGTYNVVNYGVAYNNGSAVLNIKGGTVNSARRAYYKGVTTISGGTINGTISDVATTVITGGVFNNDPTAYVDVENYQVLTNTPSEGYWTVGAPQPVAQIGANKYETLAAAILAAQSGDTIEILDGTWGADAVGTLTTSEALSVRAKSLTIQAASGASPKFTSNVTLGYDDSSTRNATMTVKGLAFENAQLLVGNYAQATVEGCAFSNATLRVIESCSSNYNRTDFVADQVTIKDCTFDGTPSGEPAIRVRNSGNLLITGNTVANSAHNGILLESNGTVNTQVAKTIVVTDNTITEWNAGNVAGGGRGIRADLGGLAAGSTVTVRGNVLRKGTLGNDTPDFMKITGAGSATVDLSGNDWNDMLLSEVLGNGAVHTCDVTPTLSSVVTTRKEPVAQIGANKYESLRAAIEAVPTDGTATTITMIDDSAEAAVITIPATKNVVLDLNGKTVSYTTDAKSVYFLTNKGTLTVKDTSTNADGQILLTAQPDTGYSVECVTVYNLGGTLTLESGTIKNATGGGLAYAVNNSSNAWGAGDDKVSTFNMTGGKVSAPGGDAALRVYQNCAAHVAPVSKNYVNISGGTIVDTGIFVDTVLYTDSGIQEGFADSIDTQINISGGTVNGLIDLKIRHKNNTKLNITGGDFTNAKLWVRKKADEYKGDDPTEPMVSISGGKFAFVTGKAFGLAYDCGATSWTSYEKPYAVSGGIFSTDPSAYVADGYVVLANEDVVTKDAYPYMVALGNNVTFELGESAPTGAEKPSDGAYAVGTALPLPTYTSADTTFAGWKVAGAGDAIMVLPAGMTGDITLVATWTVAQTIEVITTNEQSTVAIKVTEDWIAANVTNKEDSAESPTVTDIQEALNETADNGLKVWENYVIGQDPSTAVAVGAEQGAEITAMPVSNTLSVQPVDTGFTVEYSLKQVDTNGTTVATIETKPTTDFDIDLSKVSSNAYYVMTATIKTDAGAMVSTVTSTNVIGVLKVESAATTTAVAVPWASYDGTNDISVADIVRTANLTEGDSLKAYDPDSKTYKEWTLGADKTWQPSSTISTSGNESAGNADAYKVARGSAVWLTRTDPSQPIYLVGGAASGTVETKLEAAPSDTKSSWNLVGNPKVESVDVKNLLGAKTGDQVIVPTAGAPKNYVYVEGKGWGYYKTVPYEIDGVKVGVVSVFTTVDTDVPAGTGFWYLNSSTSKDAKINW